MNARALLVALLLAPAVPWSQARIDTAVGRFRAQDEVLYLWSGQQARKLFPGFESLAADVYWLRTVQYFGGQRVFARGKRFELLRPLIDITTTLDPRLEIAYRYGAIFLSEASPFGAGRPREGVEVLELGVRNLPSSWRLRQDLGFFYYLYLHDPEHAAEVLSRAADVPGAPYWLRTLAADVLAKSGDRQRSRRMWQQMYDQAEPGAIRENAKEHLRRLDSLDLADRLTEEAHRVAERAGHPPATLDELRALAEGHLPTVDAAGVPFSYDPKKGVVAIARDSPMWRTND
ncbi:MAG TPA: hypothetical protein VEQ10_07005 [Vicinamibacteria bacterium]|nr:hypothetical protein [Vicinamibacteria bacterium]